MERRKGNLKVTANGLANDIVDILIEDGSHPRLESMAVARAEAITIIQCNNFLNLLGLGCHQTQNLHIR